MWYMAGTVFTALACQAALAESITAQIQRLNHIKANVAKEIAKSRDRRKAGETYRAHKRVAESFDETVGRIVEERAAEATPTPTTGSRSKGPSSRLVKSVREDIARVDSLLRENSKHRRDLDIGYREFVAGEAASIERLQRRIASSREELDDAADNLTKEVNQLSAQIRGSMHRDPHLEDALKGSNKYSTAENLANDLIDPHRRSLAGVFQQWNANSPEPMSTSPQPQSNPKTSGTAEVPIYEADTNPHDLPSRELVNTPLVQHFRSCGMNTMAAIDLMDIFLEGSRDVLVNGVPFYWSSEIARSVRTISRSIPEWTLREEELPTKSGFWWFDEPMDLVPGDEPYIALGWTVVIHREEVDREFQMTVANGRQVGDSGSLFLIGYSISRAKAKNRLAATGPDGRSIYPHRLHFWPIGMKLTKWTGTDGSGSGEDRGGHHHDDITGHRSFSTGGKKVTQSSPLELAQFFAGALQFLKQKILVTETRNMANRTERKRIKGSIARTSLQVVHLRKSVPKEQSVYFPQGHVQWSCQWMVHGHWRNQWYPSEQIHRLKYIDPYVKGPDDKPLREPGRKVYAVVR